MHINFKLGQGRGVLHLQAGGSASLDRTLAHTEWASKGVWRGYWPIGPAIVAKLLAWPEVKQAIRRNAAWQAWQDAVEVHGIGKTASAVFAAVAD